MYELHDFARSSAAYRVRIALALKQVSYSTEPVNLVAGEHYEGDFRSLNPQSLVPVYSDENIHLTQSLAIIEYLDERYPEPPLFPKGLAERAHVRQIAQLVASDIHPLNGFRVHAYLRDSLRVTANKRRQWFRYWIMDGLDALELLITSFNNRNQGHAVGDKVTLADIVIIPQMDLARRNGIDIEEFPRLAAIFENCMAIDAFSQTHADAAQ